MQHSDGLLSPWQAILVCTNPKAQFAVLALHDLSVYSCVVRLQMHFMSRADSTMNIQALAWVMINRECSMSL